MKRLKFIGKKLLYLLIMLIGVATLVFILTKLVPGDPVVANLSQRSLNDPEVVAAYKAKYGLDQPIPVQYVMYMKNLLKLDLGTSIRHYHCRHFRYSFRHYFGDSKKQYC